MTERRPARHLPHEPTVAAVSATTKAGVQRRFARLPIESFLVDAALIVAWHFVMDPLTRVMSAHLTAAILGVALLQVVAAGRAAGNIFFGTWDASEALDATLPPRGGLLLHLPRLCAALGLASSLWLLGTMAVLRARVPAAVWALPIPSLFGAICVMGASATRFERRRKLVSPGEALRGPRERGADAALLLVYLLTTEALLFASLGDQRRENLVVLFFCALVYLPCRLAFAFAPPTSRYEPLSALVAFVWFLVAAA